jgi:hypothetical protein
MALSFLRPHFPLYRFQDISNMSVQPKYVAVLPVLERKGTAGIEIFFDEENVKGKD